MFKKKFYLIVLLVALLAVVQMAFGAETASDEWKVKMRNLAASLNNLLPDISSKTWTDKKNADTARRIKELAKAVEAVEKGLAKHESIKKEASLDPIFSAVLVAFRDDVKSAVLAYEAGRIDYAKALLRTSVAYCTSCHTRHEDQSDFKFPIFAQTFKTLSLTEKMKLLAASRQFQEALDVFEAESNFQSMSSVDNFELEGATRLAIAIMVRVKQNPDPARELITRIKKTTKRTPDFYKELNSWLTALNEWKAEAPQKLESEADYLARMNQLMKRARERQEFPFDQRADVDYLRATALMHAYLDRYPKSKHLGEVLMNLGKSYEVLHDLGFWSLHENYYEACVRSAPKTSIAKECFSRYEDSTVMGYTGSSGTKLPSEVKEKISELKKIAF